MALAGGNQKKTCLLPRRIPESGRTGTLSNAKTDPRRARVTASETVAPAWWERHEGALSATPVCMLSANTNEHTHLGGQRWSPPAGGKQKSELCLQEA